MAQPSLDAEVFGQLTHEQKALLDTVDSLRSQGVGQIIDLPQIIVVGGQSSGKSSVLEAISRVRFPVKGGVCTRFATELVVSTASRESAVIKIGQGSAERVVFNEQNFTSDNLPELIERAKTQMRVDNSGFSEDTLRIEVSGPNLDRLTLIDLPGVYSLETADQTSDGIKIVWRLVNKYMEQKKSIILAIVNASYGLYHQGILKDVKLHDPNQERTIGVITNPDRLEPKSKETDQYLRLLRNLDPLHTLKQGWHVLRNRGPEANDEQGQGESRTTDKERDEDEEAFLSSGVWGTLPAHVKGVDHLRRKLSKVLTKHIELSLPGVIRDIEVTLEARRDALARLGQPRKKNSELRHYMYEIASRLGDLTRQAIRGTYDDVKFFGDPYAEDYPRGLHDRSDARRLRAVVRNLNHAFDVVISSKGARRKIIWPMSDAVDSDGDSDDVKHSVSGSDNTPGSEKKDPVPLTLYMRLYDVEEPKEVTWADLEKELETNASVNLNASFPGSANDRLALDHFRNQSKRWPEIAAIHIRLVVESAKKFTELALSHITAGDERTRDALLREFVDPFFERRTLRLEQKLDELLWHYKNGEALTLESDFIRALSVKEKSRRTQNSMDIGAKDKSKEKSNERQSRSTTGSDDLAVLDSEVSHFGLEKVVDMASVYYEMSLRTFTENVIILAVENCLISELPSILTTSMVHEMDEETLIAVAKELPEVELQRTGFESDVEVLKKGLLLCKKHRPRESSGHISNSASHTTTTDANGRSSTSTPLPETANSKSASRPSVPESAAATKPAFTWVGSSSSLFPSSTQFFPAATPGSSPFGAPAPGFATTGSSGGLFGRAAASDQGIPNRPGSLFGQSLFQAPRPATTTPTKSGSSFGSPSFGTSQSASQSTSVTNGASGGLFGAKPAVSEQGSSPSQALSFPPRRARDRLQPRRLQATKVSHP